MTGHPQDWRSVVVVVGGALLLTMGLVGTMPHRALAQPAGYVFTPVAFIPGAAPGGGTFVNDFEPGAINIQGEVVFVADASTGGEGVFVGSTAGPLAQIVRTGQGAPGGGTFASLELGHTARNDRGDGAFAFTLETTAFPCPFEATFACPFGLNSGVYRFAQNTRAVTPLLVPGQTRAPGGGTFAGTFFHTNLNNSGDLAFSGMVPATIGPGASIGLGLGAFQARNRGQITTVARPGDPAPGGDTFDFVIDPWINDGGDVAFDAHVAGEECIDLGQTLPAFIFCTTSMYKKTAAGAIQSIAHQGEPAPGGGTYRLAFGPVMNNAGDLVFIGDLTPAPDAGLKLGVFLHTGGTTIPVVRPGDPLPGGGLLDTATFFAYQYGLNNLGDVTFTARLNTDVDQDGVRATGLYVLSDGSLQLVARTGTVIPGVGTVAHVNPPSVATNPTQNPHDLFGGGAINDLGEILFQVTLTDGRGVLLVATPGT
jgi:hypothetical protein